jgi:hypothetical protein
MMKLLAQLLQVDKATPFALNDDGKISDGKAQGTVQPRLVLLSSSIATSGVSTYLVPS